MVLCQTAEEKLDSVKDKLMLEALMKQIGAAEWQQLSEKERQQKLIALKRREKELQREGIVVNAYISLV